MPEVTSSPTILNYSNSTLPIPGPCNPLKIQELIILILIIIIFIITIIYHHHHHHHHHHHQAPSTRWPFLCSPRRRIWKSVSRFASFDSQDVISRFPTLMSKNGRHCLLFYFYVSVNNFPQFLFLIGQTGNSTLEENLQEVRKHQEQKLRIWPFSKC